ncbi:MAG TPA: nitroreductase family deazaflavin-dependent oxidoreductase [Acidimicrobiales bacterium]|nr:nitroreductase family deazaflavin-dependent oxidoreductase [Acidimicrobiales bacterium]
MGLFDLSHKPTGWQRRLLNAPTYVYRAHLGAVFGHRFLMIEHRGRKSGEGRRTVVEVAGRIGDDWICSSGTGPHADWYLNLQANGLEAVWIGSRRHHATVRFLPDDEAATVMADYERKHPKTAARLYVAMGVSYDGTHEDLVRMMTSIPMVAFTLTD